ncbi:hypothetical protein TRAPUB_9142 [Trametes pubescens]|uniref:Uncharacterized protein n=1 Tax=Trametes pubescens TaxID=154538 RepID=A0A1M2W3E1_TRAPU|nr:hypothetical protein TRAPUB_9142 [Trametes pubescens]
MPINAGQAPNLRAARPSAPMPMVPQGGNGKTMFLGMAGVALGLYGFWRLQFAKQNRSHSSANPAEMPTWQFRHAQQVPEFNDRMSATGKADSTSRARASSSPESVGASFVQAKPADSAPAESAAPPVEKAHPVRNVVASVLSTIHGSSRERGEDAKGPVGQPAEQRRINDRGGMYTKNSDYKDGYRRD